MFALVQIEQAYKKVKSGSDFPKYIQEIKQLVVKGLETLVIEIHIEYFGKSNSSTNVLRKYDDLFSSENSDSKKFDLYLKVHQKGETDYFIFYRHSLIPELKNG